MAHKPQHLLQKMGRNRWGLLFKRSGFLGGRHHLRLVDETDFDMAKGVEPVMYPDHSVTRETLVSAILALHLILVSVYTSLQHSRLAELNALFEKIKDDLPRPDDAVTA